ncbi:MAG TPA: ribosome maturation factor RimM [Limnobacter sp.]|nr:ribosome maturation factor RimM [Limnobacter sp.]
MTANKPDDLVELGRIGEPYGLKGWVNVLPSSEDPVVLLKAREWWISRLPAASGGAAARVAARPRLDQLTFESFRILQVKTHADRLVAHLEGVEHRELAATFKGCRVHVSRARFPAPADGEYYWVDLVGCQVSNPQGHELGVVSQVVDHGAHPILVVKTPSQANVPGGECLIPFVEAYVLKVDVLARQIVADWQLDY